MAPHPTWDKSHTPAIPPKLTLARPLASCAITHAQWITGRDPVGIYLVARSSRPRKSIPTTTPRSDSTIQSSLPVCAAGYSSFSQVYLLQLLSSLYAPAYFLSRIILLMQCGKFRHGFPDRKSTASLYGKRCLQTIFRMPSCRFRRSSQSCRRGSVPEFPYRRCRS